MKKPYEQEWTTKPWCGETGISDDSGRVIFFTECDATEADIDLASAAPAMARALLGAWHGGNFHGDGGDVVVRMSKKKWDAFGAALKKAGVL
jgi:hypothetical protein